MDDNEELNTEWMEEEEEEEEARGGWEEEEEKEEEEEEAEVVEVENGAVHVCVPSELNNALSPSALNTNQHQNMTQTGRRVASMVRSLGELEKQKAVVLSRVSEEDATRLSMIIPFSKITVVKLKAFTREMASFRKAHAPNDQSDEAFSPGIRETFKYAGFLPYRL
jgi:hypothetical protein